MKVKELIKLLQERNPEDNVVLAGELADFELSGLWVSEGTLKGTVFIGIGEEIV